MKLLLTLILTFFVLFNSISGQQATSRIGLSAECLMTRDFSVVIPDEGHQFRIRNFAEPAVEFQIDFPRQHNLRFETGYRWKQHYLLWKAEGFGTGQWVETTHSIPLRVNISNHLSNRKPFNRFSYTISSGVLLDVMQQSSSLPIIYGGNNQGGSSNGTISFSYRDYYDEKDINQVKASVSLDGSFKLGFQVIDLMQVFVGYGYTVGFRKLAQGRFAGSYLGVPNSGAFYCRGTYTSSIIGIRFNIEPNVRGLLQ